MLSSSDRETSCRLSPIQEEMLLRHQPAPAFGTHIQGACSFLEELEIDIFIKTWQAIVSRHQSLRTSFQGNRRPVSCQSVQASMALPFEIHDWRDLSADVQQSRLLEYLQLDRKKGFLLTEAPLMRFALFCMAPAHYELVWTSHPVIADHHSYFFILDEVFATYDNLRQGKSFPLKAARPYGEYVTWLAEQDSRKTEKFWRNLLDGINAPTFLASTPGGGNLQAGDPEYAECEKRLPQSVTTALRALGAEHHLKLDTILQGAWALLLHRYSGEEDVTFGIEGDCRSWAKETSEAMVGPFINTVPLRLRIVPEMAVITWLQEIKQQRLAILEHGHASLLDIRQWSNVPADLPLFETILVFNECESTSLLRSSREKLGSRTCKLYQWNGYPITLHAYAETGLFLRIIHDRQYFDHGFINRLLAHLNILLEAIARAPAKPLAHLPILTDAERRQVLVEWNATSVDYPRTCLHQLFESQVERTPERIAVVFAGQQLTYRELNERANQVGHYLRKFGVGPDVLVGLFMERSLEMVIGIYGIIKAGGAYVPLDPEYPSERVEFMAKETKAPVLLTQKHLLSRLPRHDARVICLDTDWPEIARESADDTPNGVTEENLAYVIYTSGSTGKPKGVMNTHRGICNRLHWMQDAYRLTGADRILQKTLFGFDVSVWEFFWPLLFGARLIVARPKGHLDGNYLIKLIQEQGVTTLHFVPSMLEVFLDYPEVAKCASLRRVICSGEALPRELQKRFFEKMSAELHNLYGPTEAAVDVTSWVCRRDCARRLVPIGRPVANTQLYILDRYLQPVPVGVIGELFIGGVQVARGYLNRPELTTEKFIPDPFSRVPGARLYRTGDLARYLADGTIEYLGRTDHQIKIRGIRIELGEIDAVLGSHKSVRQAVTTAREDTPGGKQLVAYLVLEDGEPPSAGDLRRYLKDRLPEQMVPSTFVIMEKFPLSANGKIDRQALPLPPAAPLMDKSNYVLPGTELERTVAAIWQEVLLLEKVGIHDNFFDLGGHSLRMAQVHSRLRSRLGREFPLLEMFSNPTVFSLACFLSQHDNKQHPLLQDEWARKLHARKYRMKQRLKHRAF
jgi:surfactin family lipopeptide synthetase C